MTTKKAILSPHFEGLLQVVRRPGSDGKWSADDFLKAGCFGPFLSLLSLIEHNNTGEETGGSVWLWGILKALNDDRVGMKITPRFSQYCQNMGDFPLNCSCSQKWVICRGKLADLMYLP